jgi:3-hydroxyisobutyrate dehydrogenase-like beta-hydroxyacid dehydrogenase
VCHDIRHEPSARLNANGVRVADSLIELAADCDIVFLCLASAQATSAVASELLRFWGHVADGAGRMRTLVDTGTTSLATTRALAALAQAQGHAYADAPVARMPAAAVAGTLSIMVGTDLPTLQRIAPYLRCMGTDVTHCGAVGSGQVVKILHNTLLFETVHALAEAIAVARRHGVDGEVLIAAIELGSADCQAARVQGRQALLPRIYPRDRFCTRYALKDVSLALELADLAGIALSVGPATAAVLQSGIDAGYGDQYYPSLYEVIAGEKKAGP